MRNQVKQSRVKKMGLVVKLDQPEAMALAVEVGVLIVKHGIAVVCEDKSAQVAQQIKEQVRSFSRGDAKKIQVGNKEKIARVSDMVVVVGGDGTYLSIARMMHQRSVPIMGINMGQLGFLTEIKRDEAFDVLNRILEKREMKLSERALLEVSLKRGKKTVYTGCVLNDAVISKSAIARIIGVQIGIDGKWVNSVRADGIIVSTPTGSTAYSLASGGPIVEPSLPALLITPICAHSLTQRPIVVSDRSEIQIRLIDRPGEVVMTLDGQDAVEVKSGDIITVKRLKRHSLKLISSPTRDYFSLLHEKLKFGLRPT